MCRGWNEKGKRVSSRHRRRDIFCCGGGGGGGRTVNYLPKKFFATCPKFYETVEKKRGSYDALT